MKFSDEEMKKLKDECEKTFTEEELKEVEIKNESCSICLEKYDTINKVIEFKKCPHYYHSICIENWLKVNSKCPLCKENKKCEIEVEEETQERAILFRRTRQGLRNLRENYARIMRIQQDRMRDMNNIEGEAEFVVTDGLVELVNEHEGDGFEGTDEEENRIIQNERV